MIKIMMITSMFMIMIISKNIYDTATSDNDSYGGHDDNSDKKNITIAIVIIRMLRITGKGRRRRITMKSCRFIYVQSRSKKPLTIKLSIVVVNMQHYKGTRCARP